MTLSEQQSFGFTSTNGRRVAGKFDGGAISSDGGLMLVREADRKLKLTGSVAKLFEDRRQAGKVKHEIEHLRQQAKDRFEESGQKQRLFDRVSYAAKTSKHKRSFICKAEHADKGSNPRFLVARLIGGRA